MHPIRSRALRRQLLFITGGFLLLLFASGILLLAKLLYSKADSKLSIREPDSVAVVATPKLDRRPLRSVSKEPSIEVRPVQGVETVGIAIPFGIVKSNRTVNYWEQKLTSSFQLVGLNSTLARLAKAPEEESAVFATLSDCVGGVGQVLPLQSVLLTAGEGPLAVLYLFETRQGSSLHSPKILEFEFIAEAPAMAAGSALTLRSPPDAVQLEFVHSHFPKNDFENFWKNQQDKRDQLFAWIRETAAGSLSTVLTVANEAFYVNGIKTKAGSIERLKIVYLGAGTPRSLRPPQGYLSKDFADFNLERFQEKPHQRLLDRLGAISGLGFFSEVERFQVKTAIWQYFEKGTREAEVDVRLPNEELATTLLATLHFQSSPKHGFSDVILRRIGTEPFTLSHLAVNLGPETVFGFGDIKQTPLEVLDLWKRRYPSSTIQSFPLDDLSNAFRQARISGSGRPEWFEENYGIKVLDATSASGRLREVHGLAIEHSVGTKDFRPEDFYILEAVLGTMSQWLLGELRGLQILRQERCLSDVTNNATPKKTGMFYLNGDARTVAIFDAAYANDDALFCGDVGRVFPAAAHTYAHELGHAIGALRGRLAQFNKFAEIENIPPVTWYAGSQMDTEFFPECFALFQLDPAWMLGNHPGIFKWLNALANRNDAYQSTSTTHR